MMRYPVVILLLTILTFVSSNILAKPDPNDLLARLRDDTHAYQVALLNGDSASVAENSYLIAKRNIGLGNYSQAQQWLQKALDMRLHQQNFESVGKIYLRMEEIQFILQHPKEGIQYAALALINFNKVNSDKGRMGAYNALGASYFLTWEIYNKLPERRHRSSLHYAIRYYDAALKIAQSINSAIDIGQNYRYLGKCWQYKDKEVSLLYQKKAWEINQTEKLFNNSVELACDIATEYLHEGKTVLAKQWLDKAQAIIDGNKNIKTGLRNPLETGYFFYYERIGNWKLALIHRKNADALVEGSFQQYRSEAVEGTKNIYEARLKEVELKARHKEIAILRESAKTKNKLIAGIAVLFLIAGVASLLYSVLYSKYKALSSYNATLIKEQSHRTKNNLQAICNLLSLQLYKLSDPDASKILEESILRVEAINMIHHKLHREDTPMFISLPEYINDLVKSILRIYKMEFVDTTILIDPIWLHAEKAVPLGLIINELTTNSCKYAFAGDFPELTVSCGYLDNQIHFRFKDNGNSYDPQNNTSGFGLELIDMLVAQLDASQNFTFNNGFQFDLSVRLDNHLIRLDKPEVTQTTLY